MPKSTMVKRLGFVATLVGAATVAPIVGAQTQSNPAPPDFSANGTAWYHFGPELAPVPGFPAPVHDDPAYRHVNNTDAGQASYRIADLSDPNLTQWAKDIMKKDND